MIHIHWLKNHTHNFIDRVSGKTVWTAECRCGKKFMVDTLFPIATFKVELATPNKEKEDGSNPGNNESNI